MSIKEVEISHNQKKKLLKSLINDSVFFKDDNGDVVVNVENYLALQKGSDADAIETIIGDNILDFNNKYFVFS